jgi:uncharacterized protein
MPRLFIAFMFLFCGVSVAQTSAPLNTAGTLVIVQAFGEVRHENDEARAIFTVEEQDKDRVAAVNRVNQKMRQGTEIIKREDPVASLETQGYFTYPIYADELPPRTMQGTSRPPRQLVGWRVGQSLQVTTTNLEALSRTVAAAQRVLALSGLQFGLSKTTSKKLEEQRIAAAYSNLSERVDAIARAMGRSVADAVLDTLDFEGSGNYLPQQEASASRMLSAKAMGVQVEEPGFEPGETVLSMRVVGRVRFK